MFANAQFLVRAWNARRCAAERDQDNHIKIQPKFAREKTRPINDDGMRTCRWRAEKAKKYRDQRPEVFTRSSAKYREKNREAIAQSAVEYRKRTRAARYAQIKARRAADPQFHMVMLLRGRLSCALRASGAEKAGRTMELVGCTWSELKAHFETLFVDEMNWENRHLWEISHVVPCADFDLTNPEQQRACFHFTNLQPLWIADHETKDDPGKPAQGRGASPRIESGAPPVLYRISACFTAS